ncbi:signal peptidase I [Sulfuricurvum sp.]|uniref:signal peptidase I n=1 Tax=Sulfuricurvum sp. TaxID=2025608 RepID=UPI00262CAD88|nr:signal peptidase I [Sulfuricurvum sp.]MDD2266688.1 signal peptidase I [Sulfuricurvum sp.]MDD2784136.1 signal peptidase I [Sulfuricurvum sp.]
MRNQLKKIARGFVPTVLFLTLLFSLVRIYQIEDISMHPALMDGDYVIVENISAGIHVPTFFGYINKHLYDHPDGIHRGDILVFKHPLDDRLYIKRCAALPGDSVMEHNKIFYLQIASDDNMTRRYALKYSLKTVTIDGELWIKAPYASYYCIPHFDNITGPKFLFAYPKTRIPQGYYFMLGDMRDNSTDSRFFNAVPYDSIYYKLWIRIAPSKTLEELGSIRFFDAA